MPKNKKINCAVIGVGNMGKNHVRTYTEISEANLVAVADVNEDVGKKVAEEFHAKFYADYQEMLRQEQIDVVSVVVPTTLHYPVASYCIKQGVNVLVEKPIAEEVSKGEDLISLADEHKVVLMVGHIERFNPAVKKVKEMILAGSLGRISSLIARRVGGFPPQVRDADIAVDLAIHDVDIANYFFDATPDSVKVNRQKNHIEKRSDSVEFFLKYGTASAYIQANWITPVKIRKLNVTGTEGYLEMDYINQTIEFYRSDYAKFTDKIDGFSDYLLRFRDSDKKVFQIEKRQPLKEELSYFIRSVRDGKTVDSTYAIKALAISLS